MQTCAKLQVIKVHQRSAQHEHTTKKASGKCGACEAAQDTQKGVERGTSALPNCSLHYIWQQHQLYCNRARSTRLIVLRTINLSIGRKTDRRTDRRTDGRADRQADGQADRPAGQPTDGEMDRLIDRTTNTPVDRRTNQQTDRQTDGWGWQKVNRWDGNKCASHYHVLHLS